MAAVLALFVLAPWAAECSWGGYGPADYPAVILFLAPQYGGAAVLIREVARRTGGGWPAIVLLAGAFGVVQAGLVDQSLFNRTYLADTEYAFMIDNADRTWLWPGFSVGSALDYVGNHIVLSICAPIAIVETFVRPERRTTPWLRWRGLTAVAVVYVLGSLLIFSDSGGRKDFLASPQQLSAAATVVITLVVAALAMGTRPVRTAAKGRAPAVWVVGLVAVLAQLAVYVATGWPAVGVRLAAALVAAALVLRWARRPGWGQAHVLVVAGAGLVLAAAGAWSVPLYDPASPTASVVGDVAVALITLGLLAGAALRLRPVGPARPIGPVGPVGPDGQAAR